MLGPFWMTVIVLTGSAVHDQAGELSLRHGSLTIKIDPASGGIRSVADAALDVHLEPREAAEAFRLILRRGDRSLETISSRTQTPPRWERFQDRCTAEWSGPLKGPRGDGFDIRVRVTYRICASEEGRPDLRVWMSVDNRGPASVLEVLMPAVGGLEALGGAVTGSHRALTKPLTRPFGDWAPHYPGAIPMPFVHIGGERGVYFGAHEVLARFKLLRLHEDNNTIAARVTHVPLLPPGNTFVSCAAVYRLHKEGFAGSGRTYRSWFVRTFGVKDPWKDWIRKQSFFQMTMMMLPEGNINYRFKDIPRLAADAKKYGVTAIQLAGWQRGGHDGGYPYYEPDPRLGTWEDLRQAIRACHRMGVRVFFFVNVQVAMLDLDWYRRELRRYETETEAGDPFWVAGWGMGTLASRMGLTTPLMAFLDPAFPRYADALMVYYRKLADIGADGVHVDKMFPAALNANRHAPLPPDTSPWEGAIRFLRRMDTECRRINPNWRVSAECSWDRFLSVGTATWWAGNMSAVKEVFPETAETVGLYQPYDYAGVNNAVREGHVVMVAPYHFQRSMDEPAWRGLSRYIRDVKAIRDRLAAAVFLGERLEPTSADIQSLNQSVVWAVYRNPRWQRRVCIVTNNSGAHTQFQVGVWPGTRSGLARVHLPGRSAIVVALPATIDLPPERLVFVEELREGAAQAAGRRVTWRSPETSGRPIRRPFANADFERGTLEGWQADANWKVDDNSAGGWYSGWQGRWFAWSGSGGEQQTGKLRSPVFTLEADGVEVSVAGWSDIQGQSPDRWNYVTLNLEDGTEIDRIYTANTTTFTPLLLFGKGHRGKRVYLEVVDDAPEATYSMICIDDVRFWDMPPKSRSRTLPPQKAHVLENAHFRVEIGRTNGTITRILDKATGVEVIGEPRLSDNWRFSLPVRDAVTSGHTPMAPRRRWPESWRNHEGNYVRGRLQRLTSVRRQANSLVLTWAGPLKADDGQMYPVSVVMRVLLSGDKLTFHTTIHNRSGREVGEVSAPLLGGLQGWGRHREVNKLTELVTPEASRLSVSRPFHTFVSQSWLGIFGPERHALYPTSLDAPWCLLRNRSLERSLYIGAHDSVARAKVLHLEMFPGVSGSRPGGNWPTDAELEGRPVGVKLAWVHLTYHPPGRTFEAAPVVLCSLTGSAEDAWNRYRSWLRGRYTIGEHNPDPRWREVERDTFERLKERLPLLASEGHSALKLMDWRAVGPDAGVPLMEPDPALGGWSGLAELAEVCRSHGVGLIVQLRLNPVTTRSQLFRTTLHRFQTCDRWGVPQTVLGWGNPRTTAEVFSTGERRSYINPGHAGLRTWLVGNIERLARAGVTGVHISGYFANVLDFNPTLGVTPDVAMWGAALETLKALEHAGRRHVHGFRVTVDERRDLLSGFEDPQKGGISDRRSR